MSTKKVMVGLELKILKTKSQRICACAMLDLGYRSFPITWDEQMICEMFNLTMKDLYELKIDFEKSIESEV